MTEQLFASIFHVPFSLNPLVPKAFWKLAGKSQCSASVCQLPTEGTQWRSWGFLQVLRFTPRGQKHAMVSWSFQIVYRYGCVCVNGMRALWWIGAHPGLSLLCTRSCQDGLRTLVILHSRMDGWIASYFIQHGPTMTSWHTIGLSLVWKSVTVCFDGDF